MSGSRPTSPERKDEFSDDEFASIFGGQGAKDPREVLFLLQLLQSIQQAKAAARPAGPVTDFSQVDSPKLQRLGLFRCPGGDKDHVHSKNGLVFQLPKDEAEAPRPASPKR